MNLEKYRNTGVVDRGLRVIIATVLIYFGFINTAIIGQALVSNILGILGIVNLVVAITGICPIYSIAGIKTCSAKKV